MLKALNIRYKLNRFEYEDILDRPHWRDLTKLYELSIIQILYNLNDVFVTMSVLKVKNIFLLFHIFVSKLINVVKLDVENKNIALTLSNVVNIIVEIYSVDLTFFNVVNFSVEKHIVVSTLIWFWLCNIIST